MSKLHVAVVGMGFGAEFVPIYLDHPDVRAVTACDLREDRLAFVKARFPAARVVSGLDEPLGDADIDAIHITSGIPEHAPQAVAALEAGKHCACTVPAATRIDDLKRIVEAERASGKRYMMMETTVYTRQFLYAKQLLAAGEFGHVQFLRGAHYQCLEQWPSYWEGLPPMWYMTHAIAPLLALAGTRATKVHCFGTGVMREELTKQYGNPYPVETAIFQLEAPDLAAEVTRSLFHCARPYMESFTVYGENACYEWQMESEPPMLFRASRVMPGETRKYTQEQPALPDNDEYLPEPVRRYTRRFVYGEDEQHLSFQQGGGHHGSHPHMVHEFVRAVIEDRHTAIDSVTAANWTAPGICAHESAMTGGAEVLVPAFG